MKKSYYCEKLEKTLHFLPNEIKFCCSCAEGLGIKIKDNSKIDKKAIKDEKEKFIKMLEKGIIPNQCKGCVEYKEQNSSSFIEKLFKKRKSLKIQNIIVDHFKQCDCSCVYCSQKILHPNVVQNYELLPLVKQLYQNDMIDDNLEVEFQGGNISMLKEFDALMEEFEKHRCKSYIFLINSVKYLPVLERVGNDAKKVVCVSLDAGTRETFKKVKGIDAFEQTLENIRKLKQNSNVLITLKYIIIKGLNDNKEELNGFLKFANSIGELNSIVLEIDYRNTLLPKDKKFIVEKHYYELFDLAEHFCRENKLPYYISDFTKSVLQKGYSD